MYLQRPWFIFFALSIQLAHGLLDEAPYPVLTFKNGDDLVVWMSNLKGRYAALGALPRDPRRNYTGSLERIVVCALPHSDGCPGFICTSKDSCAPDASIKVVLEHGYARFVLDNVLSEGKNKVAFVIDGVWKIGMKIDRALVESWSYDYGQIKTSDEPEPESSDLVYHIQKHVSGANMHMQFGEGNYAAVGFRRSLEEGVEENPTVVFACASGVRSCKEFVCENQATTCRIVGSKETRITKSRVTKHGHADISFSCDKLFEDQSFTPISILRGSFIQNSDKLDDKVENQTWTNTYVYISDAFSTPPFLMTTFVILGISFF